MPHSWSADVGICRAPYELSLGFLFQFLRTSGDRDPVDWQYATARMDKQKGTDYD